MRTVIAFALLGLASGVALGPGCSEPATDPAPPAATGASALASTTAHLDGARLTPTQRERLSVTRVPPLLPDIDGLDRAVITAGPGWYAASLALDDHTLIVEGTRQAFVEPELELDGEPPFEGVTRTHAIAELSFVVDDVAYSVGVDCVSPLDNPRCAEDDYLLALRAALRPVAATPRR